MCMEKKKARHIFKMKIYNPIVLIPQGDNFLFSAVWGEE